MGLFDFFKKKPTIPAEALTLWVHRLTHLETVASLHKDEVLPVRPLAGVFGLMPALMTNEGPIPVCAKHLEGLKLSNEEALQRATANVTEHLSSVGKAEGLDFYIWSSRGAEAVALVGQAIAKSVSLRGAPVVMLPRENLALMASVDDLEALTAMMAFAETSYDESPEFRSLRAISWGAEALPVEWLPPEGHPLHTRFRTAAAKTRRHEAQELHHVHASEVAPLAHLAVLESHGGVLQAAWVRDADVVMPRVDRVTLIDSDDQPLNRIDVDFATLLEVLPPAFEPIALTGGEESDDEEVDLETAKAFRMRGTVFPTVAQRRFLLQRMAYNAQSPGAEARDVAGEELLAAWDAGEPIVAEAAVTPGHVTLESADRRVAEVSLAQFGDRMERCHVQDQVIFFNSFLAGAMLRAMAGQELSDDDMPSFPEGLQERAANSRPTLMSSNMLRALKKREAGDEDDVGQQMMRTSIETWEPGQLFPAVRPPGYDEGKRANYTGMASGIAGGQTMEIVEPATLSRPAAEGLRLELVSDRPQQMMVLNADLLPPSLHEAAWRSMELNLEAASLQPLLVFAPGRYRGPWHDSYDFARVLVLPKLVSACRVQGAPLVFAPTVGRVWVTGSDDLEGQTAVLDEIDAHLASGDVTSPYQFRELLFGWPWTVKDGALVRWALPATHPLAERIATLDAHLEKRRKSSRQNVQGFAAAAYRPGPETPESSA